MADKERQKMGAESVPAENTNGAKVVDNYHAGGEITGKEAPKCTEPTRTGVDDLANTTSSLVRDAKGQEEVARNSSKPTDAPTTVKKPTKKRKAREPLPGTSSKRRSDRTNLHRKQVESLFQVSTSNLGDQEREIFELKLDKLGKILATEIPSAQYFTIAGRLRCVSRLKCLASMAPPHAFFAGGKLFEPAGRISRHSVKHLGRNAGSCMAPALIYDSKFEVGETSTCHHWRKMALGSKTYEGLALSLRLLDNYIDKAVSRLISEATSCTYMNSLVPFILHQILASASSLARRFAKKGGNELAVRCAQRDSETGIFEYFVVTGSRRKGQWSSELDVDLPALIQYRVHQQRPYIRPLKTSQTKYKPAPLANKPAITTQNTARSFKPVPRAKPRSEIRAAVDAHTSETLAQLKISASRGQKSVPGHVMEDLRNRTTLRLKQVSSFSATTIRNKLSLAEQLAVSQYIAFMKSS